METRANYATIGLFTLAVIAAGFAFVYWLARYDELGTRRTVEIVIPGTVSGLAPGGAVLFNGIKVGEVTGLEIKPEDPTRVVTTVAVDARAPIRGDTKAALGVYPLTGVAYIELTGGSTRSPMLFEQKGVPVIVGERAAFADLVSGLQSIVSKVDSTVDQVNDFIGTAKPSLDKSLKNVETFTDALAKNSDGVSSFLDNVSSLSKTVERLSGRMEGLVDHADSVVKAVDPEKVRTTVADAQQFVQKMNAAATRIDGILGKADDMLTGEDGSNFFVEATAAARSIRKIAETFEGRADQIANGLTRFSTRGLDDLTALISDARRTVARFDRIGSSFERNPQQLIFGGRETVRDYNRR